MKHFQSCPLFLLKAPPSLLAECPGPSMLNAPPSSPILTSCRLFWILYCIPFIDFFHKVVRFTPHPSGNSTLASSFLLILPCQSSCGFSFSFCEQTILTIVSVYTTTTIGESLFTLFASLTYAYHYLKTLIR